MSELSQWITDNQDLAWAAVQTDDRYAWVKVHTASAAELAPLANAMGWDTAEQAASALSILNLSVQPPLNSTALTFDRGDLTTVSWSQLHSYVSFATSSIVASHDVTTLGALTNWEHADNTYGLLTKAEINEIAHKLPSAAFDFRDETMDCDDFCDIAQGWLAEQGLGNVSIGTANFTIYENDVPTYAHAALIAVDTTGTAWWLEPQNGKVYPIQDIYIIPGADFVGITDLVF
jgi:hypothetical protein